MRLIFLTLILFAGLAGPAYAEKRIALVIGNNAYDTKGWALDNPINDANLMAQSLEAVGFEVETVLDADFDQMQEAFQRHGDRLSAAGKDTIGFFFYAGHGAQSQGLNYLVPTDARIYNEADLWREAPNLGLLTRYLDYAGNETNFIVLDACRNNPMPAATRSIPAGLAAAGRVRGTLIAYSTAPGTVAEDGSGNKNSPFTTALANIITRPGYSAESLFRVVATRVEQMTDGRQLPWTESGLRGETDFCFAGCDLDTEDTEEASALAQIIASQDLALLQGFLRNFPGSRHRGFVEDQIAVIQADQSAMEAIEKAEEERQRIMNALGTTGLVSDIVTPWLRDPMQITARVGMSERVQESDPAYAKQNETLFAFFAKGSAALSFNDQMALRNYVQMVAAAHIAEHGPGSLSIISSCSPDETDMQLCTARGLAVREFLIQNGVLATSILQTESWGPIRQLSAGDSEIDPDALNRYAALMLLSK